VGGHSFFCRRGTDVVFSLLALLEVRSKYRGQIRERDKKIASLEEERNSLLLAFRGSGRELGQDRSEPSDSVAETTSALHQEEGETVLILLARCVSADLNIREPDVFV
jgi:hypothetical protein